MPWNELLANLGVVALAVSAWTAVLDRICSLGTLRRQLLLGALMGLATLIAMSLPFQFEPGVFLDLRYTLIAITGLFGGPVAAIGPVAVAVAKRIVIGGTGVWVGIPNITLAFAVGSVAFYWTRTELPSTLKLIALSLGVVVSGSLGFFIMVPMARWTSMVEHVVAPFSLVLFISTFFAGVAISQEMRRQRVQRDNWMYRAVIEALPDCLNAKDLDGRILAANPATARLMGAPTAAAIIGKSDFDYFPASTAREFRRQEVERVAAGRLDIYEERIERRDGTTIWLATLKAPFLNANGETVGVITHNRDITDKKRLESELGETQSHLIDAMSSMIDGLALFDSNERLVFHNERYVEMFPLTADVRKPGTQLREIISTSLARGEMSEAHSQGIGPIDELVELLTSHSAVREIEMADGRWLQARTRRTANGGSMVVFSDTTQTRENERSLQVLNEKLFRMAHTDALTDITNRRAFDTRFEEIMSEAVRSGSEVGLLMIDVDRFKAFNDAYGHPAGDECLRRVAECLRGIADPIAGATLGRYGGEEFALVLPRMGSSESANIARLILAAIRSLGAGDANDLLSTVTVSVGVASIERSDFEAHSNLVKRADKALYRAKAAGRNRVIIESESATAEPSLKAASNAVK